MHKKKHYLKAGAQCQEGQVDISLTFNQSPIEQPIYTTNVPLLRNSYAHYGVWVCVLVSISPGLMKLFGEGGTPKLFVMSGELKSSISLLRIIPVDPDMTLEPKLRDKNDRWDIKGITGKVELTNIGKSLCLGQGEARTIGWWCWWRTRRFHLLLRLRRERCRSFQAGRTLARSSSCDVWCHLWSFHGGYRHRNGMSCSGWALEEKWGREIKVMCQRF